MAEELTPFIGKQPLLMKSGLVHWVTEETAARIQEALQKQSAHTFLNIRELAITINTAQVEGVYTMAQYEDVLNIKQGMYQCGYQKWHTKKDECYCKRDAYKRAEQEAHRVASERDNAPLTPEQKEKNRKRSIEMRKFLTDKGILVDKFTIKKPKEEATI